ncbi:MAG: hypothetical protein MJ185_00365 [Treponema sp.]|nr:hypothetical protein [Treponema sp.]
MKTLKTFLFILAACILAIGLCWIGFNLFIAFIYKDSLTDILIRCLTDTAFLFGASVLWCIMIQFVEVSQKRG